MSRIESRHIKSEKENNELVAHLREKCADLEQQTKLSNYKREQNLKKQVDMLTQKLK
jgi:hypothetical protein